MANQKAIKAIATGVIRFGDVEVECYVLEDGRRLIASSAAQRAIGASKNRMFRQMAARIINDSGALSLHPIAFVLPGGGKANGYEAEQFLDVCAAYLDALSKGTLHHKQMHVARAATGIVLACSKVGIVALIDEATGYQEVRAKDELGKRLARYLRDEAARWERTFPPSLVVALGPLYGFRYSGGRYPAELRSPFRKIYELVVGKEVAVELRRRNPRPRHGHNHHQFLNGDVRSLMVEDLRLIEVIASQCGSKEEFWGRLRAHYLREPLQLALVPLPRRDVRKRATKARALQRPTRRDSEMLGPQ